jgi:hypothetical protein
MSEKLIIVHGGRLGGGSTAPTVNEEAEIPTLPEGFERTYATDKEPGDTEVVIPKFEREVPPEPELTTTPCQEAAKAEAAQKKIADEMAQAAAEEAAMDEALRGGGL